MTSPVEEIKAKLGIVDVLGGYLKLEKAGINYKARCPFHNEKTPSFFVSPARQSFYCFGCGEKGDIFSFVEKFEGIDFKSALTILAERAGVKLEKFRPEKAEAKAEKKEKELIYEIMEEATQIFEKNLTKNKEAQSYLKRRGLDPKTSKDWRLGWAEDEWRGLASQLERYDKKILQTAGLLKEKDGKFYDTFRGRIIFPISDSSGKVIAFSGRSFPDKEGAPKYLNSPETPIFHKSEVLYGWHLAKNAMRKLDYAVLVEGQMDLLLCHQIGIHNAVASSGTALTESHLRKIKMLTNRVIVAYDSDSAGESATERASALALSLEMEIKIASLPAGEDPASLALKDPSLLKESLRKAVHLVDFTLNRISRNKRGTALLKEVEKKVLPYFKYIKSEIERSHFVRKIASSINVTEEAVLKELTRIKDEPTNQNKILSKAGLTAEEMLAGLVFLGQNPKLEERWRTIAGETEVDELLETLTPEKEALLFRLEASSVNGEEVLNRIELQSLKDRLRQRTQELDSADKESAKQIKVEIEQIAQKIQTLSNK